MLDIWLKNTRNRGVGRTYNRRLFGLPDRMLWVTGLTHYERARELEDWAMDAISEIFPKSRVNKNASCLTLKNFKYGRPNGGYFQPVRPYSGDLKQFAKERTLMDTLNQSGRNCADLGKRFSLQYGT